MLSYWIYAQLNFLCRIKCFAILNNVINTCTILILHNCITMCEQKYNNSNNYCGTFPTSCATH